MYTCIYIRSKCNRDISKMKHLVLWRFGFCLHQHRKHKRVLFFLNFVHKQVTEARDLKWNIIKQLNQELPTGKKFYIYSHTKVSFCYNETALICKNNFYLNRIRNAKYISYHNFDTTPTEFRFNAFFCIHSSFSSTGGTGTDIIETSVNKIFVIINV